MNDELRHLLDSGDDGRAFTAAVMLRASGALHRRRREGGVPSRAFDWLETWARPWIVAALLVVAFAAAVLPFLPTAGAATAAEPAEAQLLAAPEPEDMLVVSIGN